MKFKFEKGKKGERDFKIFIGLEKDFEAVNILEVASIINRFAKNELDIINESEYLSKHKHFWFRNLIEKAFLDAEEGIDWFTCNEEILLGLLEKPFYVQEYSLDKFLKDRKKIK